MTAAASGPPGRDALLQSLTRLARGEPLELSGILRGVEVDAALEGTKVSCHCHSLLLDGNNRPRVRDLVRVVCDHVLDYAIPRAAIREALEKQTQTGSTAHIARLHIQARRLFTDIDNSGEGGELLLFVLAEEVLRLPQLICKMDFKTSSQMHYHGADGLHAGVDSTNGKLLLYWGESKIYADATTAVRECLASLAPLLRDQETGSAPADRDLQLLQRHADLDDPALEAALREYLDPQGPHFNSLEFRGLCLVGFDCDAYPTEATPVGLEAILERIGALLPSWKLQVARRIAEEGLGSFSLHFINVPFPSAEDFRRHVRNELDLDNVNP